MVICYEWDFTLSIIRKNGKKLNAHSVVALGSTYKEAHFSMMLTLKKRRQQLISVVKVRVMHVAFAFDDNYKSIKRTLKDGMPDIPENLNL